MVAVSRKINRKSMMKMLLTGEPIKANYAKEIGLINDSYSKSKLNHEVLKVAKKIASKSNLTIKIGKKAFYKQSKDISDDTDHLRGIFIKPDGGLPGFGFLPAIAAIGAVLLLRRRL